jgi:hypothetical protein
MTLKLINKEFRPDGIFGQLLAEDGSQLAVTLTHSYENKSKTPDGTYTCRRGNHRLHSMTHDFETFEIENVFGATGILFHWGNFNRDSEGCFLLGKEIDQTPVKGIQMITESSHTFASFMEKMTGIDEFELEIVST